MRKSKLRKENSAKGKINNVAEKKGTEVKGTGETLSTVESTMDWKKELASFLRQMRDEGRAIAEEMKAKSIEGTGEGQRNQGELVAEQIFRSKMAATEDGADLRTFLSLMEQEFREMKISEDQWGLLSEEAGAIIGEEMILPPWLWEQDGRANPHGQVPYAVILGIDWLDRYKVAWFFGSDKLRTYVKGKVCDLPVLRREGERPMEIMGRGDIDKTDADLAYEELAKQVARMTTEEAAVFVRAPSKRYKAKHRKTGRIKIKELIDQARENAKELKGVIQGLNCIVELPETEVDLDRRRTTMRQGHIIGAIVQQRRNTREWERGANGPGKQEDFEDKEDSPWPKAILEFTEFDKWIEGADGIKPAADKVEAINLWPEDLTNETQVRQFLGTVNYCRMFMGPRYADLARPLVDLTLLEQEERPVGFLSQVMTPAQQRYSIYDQELLALITALDKWQHLLRLAEVTAYTDHQALTFLQRINSQKPLRGRTARWLDFLAEFPKLKITYLQGARNKVADAMSRHPQYVNSEALKPAQLLASLIQQQEGEGVHPRYSTRLATGSVPPTDFRAMVGRRSASSSQRRDGTESHISSRVPAESIDDSVQDASSSNDPISDTSNPAVQFSETQTTSFPSAELRAETLSAPEHLSAQRWREAYDRCSQFRDIVAEATRKGEEEFVHQMQGRRASKTISQKPAGLLQPLLIPSRRWSHVSLDFITDLPLTPRGHDAILVIVDSLSKMAHFIPTKKSATTAEVIDILADRLVRYHGFPDVLISDRDPRFQSQMWQLLCQRFHIKRAMSSSYHPQTDGQTERLNRTLEQMLRTYVQTDESEWERLLPALELAYNTTSHSSTELSPFEVMIGQNPVTAAEIDIVGDLAPTVTPPMTKVAYRIELPPTYLCHNVFHVSKLVPDRPRDPLMQSKEAAVG
ncbi:uncharacterized protein EMH_0062590 [Eimeria mitis]|uniref:Integrase catalytic domain-containing protein n=1 Tax=Eimeria mitis TaxID=44415 RepID=U6K1X4_9EIME|nr:uncharacterized protein EMH_0062590 [Eimeria mitis]CDJ30941.1 hypothetical protein, conserved [Eimeria mitis]